MAADFRINWLPSSVFEQQYKKLLAYFNVCLASGKAQHGTQLPEGWLLPSRQQPLADITETAGQPPAVTITMEVPQAVIEGGLNCNKHMMWSEPAYMSGTGLKLGLISQARDNTTWLVAGAKLCNYIPSGLPGPPLCAGLSCDASVLRECAGGPVTVTLKSGLVNDSDHCFAKDLFQVSTPGDLSAQLVGGHLRLRLVVTVAQG
jgi:hypothetical protein